ncbi:N-acetyltransferase [Youhaiella tibetensis]|uniref:GNAT family N-acetyltransferase n=1 Tax=Paradevosia tibetensis TaxID=1447062 RepID=A0A5B9DRK3_9HYPH|nr:GNAT family N-acetyltransferase [Youhaiella tibetensis]QEE22060.1 GNAT family N-acetyltransferase [Youhaiella tibetensis]GGF45706.1 N-acetyltransferase [Youhaiella tibetensis]
MPIHYRLDPHPDDASLGALWRAAWEAEPPPSFAPILARSLVHVGAYDGEGLVGYLNVATDGGVHAFLLDPSVDPRYRRQGIATEMVRLAGVAARARGARWLHVDFEPHLAAFYKGCGFRPTQAGLIQL